MGNKWKVINIILVVFILVGVFFVIEFDVFKRIEDLMVRQVEERKVSTNKDKEKEFMYESYIDDKGNKKVIKYEKLTGEDLEGNEVTFWADVEEPEIIYDYMYKGTIEKIEDNKIYFMVDKEAEEGSFYFENVKDYQIVLSNYKHEVESFGNLGFYGAIDFDYELYSNVEDIKFAVGKYLRLQVSRFKDPYNHNIYNTLTFF